MNFVFVLGSSNISTVIEFMVKFNNERKLFYTGSVPA
jgi:hypothetical protein